MPVFLSYGCRDFEFHRTFRLRLCLYVQAQYTFAAFLLTLASGSILVRALSTELLFPKLLEEYFLNLPLPKDFSATEDEQMGCSATDKIVQ